MAEPRDRGVNEVWRGGGEVDYFFRDWTMFFFARNKISTREINGTYREDAIIILQKDKLFLIGQEDIRR